MVYHLIAILPAGRQKTITNKSEDDMLRLTISYMSSGTITYKWGGKDQTYQVLEIRVYMTKEKWNRAMKIPFEHFIKNKKDRFSIFKEKAEALLGHNKPRVFVIMPIQGKKSGNQSEQRVYKEYDERFLVIQELLLEKFSCIAIRIDKEFPMNQIVQRIKDEIKKSLFVISDLTDERPSCYFESGYAEGLKIPIIYIASHESICSPGNKTQIHFDIHMNVNFFTNHEELVEILSSAIEKNKDELFNADNG